MTTICPKCHEGGNRVPMTAEKLTQPKPVGQGDRFPGDIQAVPAIYHFQIKWTCPRCKHEAYE